MKHELATAVLIVVLLGFAHLAAEAPSSVETTKRVLLIGIDSYSAPSPLNLRGSVNGAKLQPTPLVDKSGFPTRDMKFLPDDEAIA